MWQRPEVVVSVPVVKMDTTPNCHRVLGRVELKLAKGTFLGFVPVCLLVSRDPEEFFRILDSLDDGPHYTLF